MILKAPKRELLPNAPFKFSVPVPNLKVRFEVPSIILLIVIFADLNDVSKDVFPFKVIGDAILIVLPPIKVPLSVTVPEPDCVNDPSIVYV